MIENTDTRMLLIVDPQIDFINGSLPVKGAEKAMDDLAGYVAAHGHEYARIVITCDRHPADHCSFLENGGNWPAHCVGSSIGSCIWPKLTQALIPLSERVLILYKGENPAREEYSIFQATEEALKLHDIFKGSISEVDICGLAGDVCVADTLKDLTTLFPTIHTTILTGYTAYISPQS